MKMERGCITEQANRIALAPNLSIRRPMNDDATAKTSMAKVCTDERVALSKLNSSRIGLKKIVHIIAGPYGQFWTMGSLDDCGAMAASVIEVYQMEKKKEL